MPNLILHHYPQSPVTEKVRLALGIKNLEWQSVEIPRIPPRPDLMPMTGGYRRTPVLQIGADIYCDSQCILAELEQRFPSPTLLSAPLGDMAWGISRWIDGPVFTNAIAVVLGSARDLPADFAADRGRLYFGEDFKIEHLQDAVAHHITQLSGQLSWVSQMLNSQRQGGNSWLSGETPGLLDIMAYYIIWFLSGRWSDGDAFISQFDGLQTWQKEIEAIGHGKQIESDSASALKMAIDASPLTVEGGGVNDASGARIGSEVSVQPDVGGGDPEVEGRVVRIDAHRIAVARHDDIAGDVVVHFPRVGYRLKVVNR